MPPATERIALYKARMPGANAAIVITAAWAASRAAASFYCLLSHSAPRAFCRYKERHEISRRFMPLLTELGGWEMDFCYKHVALNGAPALQRRVFNRAKIDRPFQAVSLD